MRLSPSAWPTISSWLHRYPVAAVVAVVAVFVLYPIYYLLQAALDVGEANVRPPTAYGFGNFSALAQYSQIMFNTLTVTFVATVMALVFGFLTAWTLTRTVEDILLEIYQENRERWLKPLI